jgi:hypothetical protein
MLFAAATVGVVVAEKAQCPIELASVDMSASTLKGVQKDP